MQGIPCSNSLSERWDTQRLGCRTAYGCLTTVSPYAMVYFSVEEGMSSRSLIWGSITIAIKI